MGENLTLRGELVGHNGWVTCLGTSAETPDSLISGSRDCSVVVWELVRGQENYGFMRRSLMGHSSFIQDLVISSDGQFVLSASADSSLRLWNIHTGQTEKRFVSHTKDVLSVAFSVDNRQIVSGSRDKTIKLWNTLGECKYTITQGGHTEWVSCVRFSPSTQSPLIVSCGWDRLVKVWNLTTCTLKHNLLGHSGYLNTVTVSPDGSLCASGGKDGHAMLWDLFEGKHLYSLETDGSIIHSLCFSPNRYWLCAATTQSILIWDLESKNIVSEIKLPPPTGKKAIATHALSICWSADGNTLFAGFTDHKIRVYSVN